MRVGGGLSPAGASPRKYKRVTSEKYSTALCVTCKRPHIPRISKNKGQVWNNRGVRSRYFVPSLAAIEGMAIRKLAPPSGLLKASTVPSCDSTTDFTMASPRPLPPVLRARDASVR